MHINIKWFSRHHPAFNVYFSSSKDKDAFLCIKGVRIASHNGERFLCWPSHKRKDGGFFNFCYSNKEFTKYIIDLAWSCKPEWIKEEDQLAGVVVEDNPLSYEE